MATLKAIILKATKAITVTTTATTVLFAASAVAVPSMPVLPPMPLVQGSEAIPSRPLAKLAELKQAPLSYKEQETLRQVYQQSRPATVRLEGCESKKCRTPDGVGTGFFISADGLLLTAYHVIFRSRNLTAVLSSGERYLVEVVGFNDQQDLALLKLLDTPERQHPSKSLAFLPLTSTQPLVGEAVLSVGNGEDKFLRQATGRLMRLSAEAGQADFPPNTLEFSAPLLPGDSGGPLINSRGQVVGVVSFIRIKDANKEGASERITAYAVPVSQRDPRLLSLKRGEKEEAPVIGVSLSGLFMTMVDLPAAEFPEVMGSLGLGNRAGAFFTAIVSGSPAEKAGLRPLSCQPKVCSGDLVLAVNDKRINNFSEFQYAVRQYRPGQEVSLRVWRAGKEVKLKLKLEARSAIRG